MSVFNFCNRKSTVKPYPVYQTAVGFRRAFEGGKLFEKAPQYSKCVIIWYVATQF